MEDPCPLLALNGHGRQAYLAWQQGETDDIVAGGGQARFHLPRLMHACADRIEKCIIILSSYEVQLGGFPSLKLSLDLERANNNCPSGVIGMGSTV